MPTIKLMVKPDNTFLNLLLYEGLLSLTRFIGVDARVGINQLELPFNALRRVFKLAGSSRDVLKDIDFIKINFIGNDLVHNIGAKILLRSGVKVAKNVRIRDYTTLIKYLINSASKIIDLKDDELVLRIMRGELVIGRNKVIGAPQLFKVDRYTGYTSLDAGTTYQQYTIKTSPQWILIGVLGLMSSYVARVIAKRKASHYFIFLSPDEIVDILARKDPIYVSNIMNLKRKLIERLREIFRRSVPEDLILLKILLDTSLIDELKKLDIDHMSFQLYRLVIEGQTYKIYSTLPITIYSKPYYLEILKGIVSNVDKLIEEVRNSLDPSKPILRAIYSFHTDNKYPEADHMIEAIHEIYRLIALGDPSGLYGFIRGLETVSMALDRSRDENSRRRAGQYRRILSNISYFI